MSSSLVSRVLNNKTGVSPKNRARILRAIKESNYTPNALAQSLATKTTMTIGVVMDNLSEKFFFHLINGLQDKGEELGYNVIFCGGRDRPGIKDRYMDYFSHGRADGIITYGSLLMDEPMVRRAVGRSTALVLIEGDVKDCALNRIHLDNVGGAYRATKRLIEAGRRRICHFTGDMNYSVSHERLDGFLRAMSDYNMPILPDTVIHADFDEPVAYQRMSALIRTGTLPDACFAGGDKTAYGLLRALSENGLRAPEDIALIGFDDEEPDTHDMLFPKLTTMRQPLYEMGQAGISLLVHAIQNPGSPPQSIQFKPELVIRETCP